MGVIFPSARPILPPNAMIASFDFDGTTTAMKNLYANRSAGAGATLSLPAASDNARFGTLQMSTGTTATGRGAIESALTELRVIDPLWLWTVGFRLPTLATVSEDYIARVGLSDTFAGDFANGVYFEYERAVSPNWKFCTAIGSVYVRTVSTFLATTNWINLSIYGNGSVAVYRGNNIVLGALQGVPNTAPLGIIFQITKTAGTTARLLEVDYASFGYIPQVEQT